MEFVMLGKSPSRLLLSASIILSLMPSLALPANYPHKIRNYKNELINTPCPIAFPLNDGLYVGAALGYDSYRVRSETGFVSPDGDNATWQTILNPVGINGGGFIGYGKYLDNFFDMYLAIEAFGLAASADTSYQLAANIPLVNVPISADTDVKVKSSYGISLIPGFKLSSSNLLYLRFGYSWANMSVNQSVVDEGVTIYDISQSKTPGGINYGLGVETALYRNLSMRFEYNHTTYSSFDTDLNTQISPADNQLLLGILYRFNKTLPRIAGWMPCATLKSGPYLGVAAGYDAYQIKEDILIAGDTSFVSLNPEVSTNGFVGGGIAGYGQYFNQLHGAYLGIEIFGNISRASAGSELSAKLASSTGTNSIKSRLNVNSNYGASLLPGFKLSPATLLYLRVGYNWAVVNSEEYLVAENGLSLDEGKTNTVHGLNYGLGVELATGNESLTVRTEYTHSNNSSFNVGNLKISPENNQYMFGVIYHFV